MDIRDEVKAGRSRMPRRREVPEALIPFFDQLMRAYVGATALRLALLGAERRGDTAAIERLSTWLANDWSEVSAMLDEYERLVVLHVASEVVPDERCDT